jgi:hypothetical protein
MELITRSIPRSLLGAAVWVFVGGMAMTVGATPASAQRAINAEEACTPDVMRLCSEFIPDRGRITVCLKRKRYALSRDCRSVISPKGRKHRHKRKRRHG